MWDIGPEIIYNQDIASRGLLWQRNEILFLAEDSLYSYMEALVALVNYLNAEEEINSAQVSEYLSVLHRLEAQALQCMKQIAVDYLVSGMEPLPAAMAILSEGISEVQHYLQTDKTCYLNVGIERLTKAINIIRDVLIYTTWEKVTKAPSKDRHLNLFIKATGAVQANIDREQFFGMVWVVFSNYFQWSRRNLRRLINIIKMSPEFLSYFNEDILTYEDTKSKFKALQLTISKKAYDEISSYFQFLQNFFDSYHNFCQRLLKLFQETASKNLKMNKCFRCNYQNLVNAWTCRSCGFVFPQVPSSPLPFASLEDSAFGLVKNSTSSLVLEILVNAVDDFKDNEINQGEFFAVLDWFSALIQPLRDDMIWQEECQLLDMAIFALYGWAESQSLEEFKKGINFLIDGHTKVHAKLASVELSESDVLFFEPEETMVS